MHMYDVVNADKIKVDYNGIFARSDLIEILPIAGSVKLVLDTVKAIHTKDAQRSVWKGFQCGISLFADFQM